MEVIPAVDLGIMAEHLSAHEGVINKLKLYQVKVSNTTLRGIITLQVNMMRVHVRVMLDLVNPYYNNYIEVPPLSEYRGSHSQGVMGYEANMDNKWIALEAHNTAKNMSDENYTSALMMKDQNVRNAHVEMGLQQLAIQEKYAELINEMDWTFTPQASIQEQINTYQNFKHILDQ